jgi:glycosyltransferase involved in cell wall biosynthesis
VAESRLHIELVANIDARRPGGATTHVLELANQLARRNDVCLWLPGQEVTPRALGPGVTARSFGRRRERPTLRGAIRNEAALAVGLMRALRSHKADCVYVRETYTLAPGLIAKASGVPMFIEFNGPVMREALALGNRPARGAASIVLKAHARLAVTLTPVTETQRAYVIENYGVKAERVRVLPNGANLEMFRPRARDDARTALGLSAGEQYMVWAGTARPNQDVPLLFRAFAEVARQREDVRLLFLSDTPEAEAELTRELGIDARLIRRVVAYDDVPAYINAADIGLVTRRPSPNMPQEDSPLKLFEYLASGLPVIGPRMNGEEFIEEKALGLLYERGDARSLAAAMLACLEWPEECRRRAGDAGRAYVEEHHDWARTAEILEGFIREASGRP